MLRKTTKSFMYAYSRKPENNLHIQIKELCVQLNDLKQHASIRQKIKAIWIRKSDLNALHIIRELIGVDFQE